ncbi:MAG: hypothetical protein GY832_35485 [Chloroflexi bacterium]|nr:hypothetical protein [Chloroflexota bacterium]
MTGTTKATCDLAEIRRALDILKRVGDVVEFRALSVSEPRYRAPHTVSGYFDDFVKLAAEAVRLSQYAKGVYITLNEIQPDLLARSANRARPVGRGDPTTSDSQIVRRCWMLVDVDPVRPSGISSSEGEWQAARDAALAIRGYLSASGWPDPVQAASGNGSHLLYRIDLPPDDGGLVQRALNALAFKFNDDSVEVDESVFNPARIVRLYGTVARKGDHTPDRPHRVGHILDVPENLDTVTRDQLKALARMVPAAPETSGRRISPGGGSSFDLDAWMAEHFPDAVGPTDWKSGRRWVLPICAWNADHRDNSAYVVQFANGAIAAGCHHNGCAGKKWHDLRDVVEPGWRQHKGGDKGRGSRPQQGKPVEPIGASDPEALFSQAKNATPENRPGALMALANALVGADPFIVEGYARRVKKARLATIGTFKDSVGKAQTRAVQRNRAMNLDSGEEASGLPRIDAGDMNLPRVSAAAWDAIERVNRQPVLFRFGEIPTRIESGDDGAPVTCPVTDARMRHLLARAVDWYRVTDNGIDSALPPSHVVSDILATPNMPLPVLDTIVSVPVFAPDGTLQTTPGYHPQARTYYHPEPGFAVPDVPARPTEKDVERAKQLLLDELLSDFPFVGPQDNGSGQRAANAERAHAVSIIIQPFVRAMISSATPLYLIGKPSPGTGASLLVGALLYPASSRAITAMTEGSDDDEWRKRLTAKLLNSPPVIFIDNLRRTLDSAALAAAITAQVWEDRILGQSVVARIPIRCLWVATGNNPKVSNELARRSVRIRIDAQRDRPWLRSGFRHPNLRKWAEENRSDLVWAALTLVQNWIARGRPAGAYTLGMFQSWAETMGGILDAANISGFLGNINDFYDGADAEGAVWRAFVAAWWERFGEQAVGVADLFALVRQQEVGLELGEGQARSQRTRLGKLLGRQRDRYYEVEIDGRRMTLKIVLAGTKRRANQWQLLVTGERVNVGERFSAQAGAAEEKNMYSSSAEGDICLETGERVNVGERFSAQAEAAEEKNICFSSPEGDIYPETGERVNVSERFPGQDDAGEKKNQYPSVKEVNVHSGDLPTSCPMFPTHRHFWRRPTGGWLCCACHPPVRNDVEIVELGE